MSVWSMFWRMRLKDFLEIYDGFLSEKKSEVILKIFEELGDVADVSKEQGLPFFNKGRRKVCTSVSFSFDDTVNPCGPILESCIEAGLKSYRNKYEFIKETKNNTGGSIDRWRICPTYNIQKYDGEKEGYFTLHSEHAAAYPFRMLVWMIFLNDAQSGTEFPYQDRILKPRTGRLAIWPAAWTHPHRGVTPNQGLKYIATGWGYFLPKKRNDSLHISFDGRHADEKKINEIVV